MTYKRWAAGHLPGYLPTFADLKLWTIDNCPPAARATVDVVHHVVKR